jgi:hypothetical protein
MAEPVTVQHGDTLTKILKKMRGLKDHDIHAWQRKMARLNPHISNLNRLFPGESILVPDALHETIPRPRIWQNAFSKIPKALTHPYHGATLIYFVHPGDTIDKVAQHMFSSGPYRTMRASNKRALLIHNNPFLENHLSNGRLPTNMVLNITPAKQSQLEISHWKLQRNPLKRYMDWMQDDVRDMFRQVGPEPTSTIARLVEQLKQWGASVGPDDVVNVLGAGASGYAASGTMALANVNALMREMYTEAIETFGKKIVHSSSTNHIARMEAFLRGHPKYTELMRLFKKLPKHILLPGGVALTPAKTRSYVSKARHFRKHIALPLKKWNHSTKYVNTVAKQLNGRVQTLSRIGRWSTWYIPATLGLVSVIAAPPGLKVRTLFEEGFGILGGVSGTYAGMLVGLGVITILGLGPFGAFVAMFICASFGGYGGMKLFKEYGGGLYDFYEPQIPTGRVYHSPEQFFLEAAK